MISDLSILRKEYIVTRTMKSCTSCGDVQNFSVTHPKPESCKLADGRPCVSCLELETFDSKAEAILERLSEDRRKILTKINQRHDPFIQHLPLELASQVFAFSIPSQDPDDDPGYIPLVWDDLEYHCIQPFNIVLGAVCHAWRQVAWSTPKLWSTLPISLHRFDDRAYKDLVLEWLGRSAQTPLDVFLVYIGLGAPEEYVDMWKPLIDIANGCSSRWRTFNMCAPHPMLAYITGDGQGTSMLECLRVGPRDAELYERSPYRFSLTNVMPMPSHLFSTTMPLRSINIDWSNLITIEIGELYINEFLVLLRWAPRLNRCRLISLQDGQDEQLPPPTPTHHNTLQKLDIQALDERQTAEQLLGSLILPSLVSLICDSDYNSRKNIAAFVDRSACRLITFYDLSGDFRDLLALAPGLHTLEQLEYPGNFGYGVYDDELGRNIFPNLREILIHGGHISWRFLADLIMTCPPKTLSIHVEHPDSGDDDFLIDEESARRFQDLIANGYNINITCRLWRENKDRDLLAWSVASRMQ